MDSFQLINMNGRMYDPVLARMLSPDNNLQMPYNSQNYNRYSYVLNNPLRYTDPDGEFIVPLLIGAAISVIGNGINNSIHHQPFFSGAGKAAIFGAIGGVASAGIGSIAQGLATSAGVGKYGVAVFQALAHGFTGMALSAAQGGNPISGLVSGGASSIVGSGMSFLGSGAAAVVITGGLSGGVGSAVTGGNFWEGATTGLIVTGLNHVAHELTANLQPEPENPIWKFLKRIRLNQRLNRLANAMENIGNSPIIPSLETSIGLSLMKLRPKIYNSYYLMDFAGTPLNKRYGYHMVKNKLKWETRLKWGGRILTTVGLISSGYQTFVTHEQHWGWFVADVAFTYGASYGGLWGLGIYAAYSGVKYLAN